METISENSAQIAWLKNHKKSPVGKIGQTVRVFVIGRGAKIPGPLSKSAPAHAKKQLKEKSSIVKWQGPKAETWVLQLQVIDPVDHYGMFTPSPYSMARDLMGACFRQIINGGLKSLTVEHLGDDEDEFMGLCVGLEMAQYQFKKVWPKKSKNSFKCSIKSRIKNYESLIKRAGELGEAVNFSRYLVDMPPNLLQPQDYAKLLKDTFQNKAKTKVTIWNEQRLKKEDMGLHIAVGQAAMQGPQMVHVEYRGGGKEKPFAFVGKGITFDAGGLDIKPAAGMRLMKKDMGGSASVAGLAHWVVNSKLKLNCDFYFAIAENSVGSNSFRPGDVLTARNGLTVEIHNTDAEGRLVLADVMTVAAEKKPQLLIDIATLTGAIKHGLGGGTPGMFSNSDNLAESLLKSSQKRGDVCWRMPLVPEEKSRLRSDVADMVNCTSGFGGAITAALFLQAFTKNVPWAHFDIYGWVDSAKGPYASSGGSGQMVQALSAFLKDQESNEGN